MKWRVWITGYPGSYSIVEAENSATAMRLGAAEQKASHHGEFVEINAVPELERTTLHHRRIVRIARDGHIEELP